MENKRKYTVTDKVRRRNSEAAKKRHADGKTVSQFSNSREFASMAGKKGAMVRWDN
jgi:hypothetical protein